MAGKVLAGLGVTLDRTRDEVRRLQSGGREAEADQQTDKAGGQGKSRLSGSGSPGVPVKPSPMR